MKATNSFSVLLSVFILSQCNISNDPGSGNTLKNEIIENKWQLLNTVEEDGMLGESLDLWRNNRLWFLADSGYLISGFESRPGIQGYQGEHVGKWLHAASLAYEVNRDEKLKLKLDKTVKRLIATQLPDGYMGTYSADKTFMAVPEGGGWDTWTFRYNIYGLLTYEKYFPDERIVTACKKMVDLLIAEIV